MQSTGAARKIGKPFADSSTVGSDRPSTELFWSIRGEVACGAHAPAGGDARWSRDGWEPLPVSSQRGATRFQCQYCSPGGVAIVDRPADHEALD
jgi:hypothetical protein